MKLRIHKSLIGFVALVFVWAMCSSRRVEQSLGLRCDSTHATLYHHFIPDPPPLLMNLWERTVIETRALSLKCPEFIIFTVSALSSAYEKHHQITSAPHSRWKYCSIALIVGISDDLQDRTSKFTVEDSSSLQSLGWRVVKTRIRAYKKLQRRISRFPKLVPKYFFPFTKVVLYVDAKLLPEISTVDPFRIANELLSNTAFGIVQHERSKDVQIEHSEILKATRIRPLLDSIETLDTQMKIINVTVSGLDQRLAGVEGQILARKLCGNTNSFLFDKVWLEEYLNGSDRDQIAFYAAFNRYHLFRARLSRCYKFDRGGVYTTHVERSFSLNIHCSLSSLLSDANMSVQPLADGLS